MSQMFPSIILGIDPGARQIGVSVFKDEELIFYAVKTFKKQNRADSLQKLRKAIEKMITDYQVEFVAIEKVIFVQQHRSFVKIVYEEMKDFLKRQNIELFEYNPKLIRQIICGLQKPTKRNTALILVQRYGELACYFNVPRLWQKRYFAQLFDAIAVGLVCSKELLDTKLLSLKSDK